MGRRCMNTAEVISGDYWFLFRSTHRQTPITRLSLPIRARGIAPDLIDRVFEPYFTTRKSSGGTGLGLAIVYGFVRQAEGDITLTSTVDGGTTIAMSFIEAN